MDEQTEHTELQTTLPSLKPLHRNAIELRLIGLEYHVIAEKLTAAGYKVKEHTLRVWFMKNGICHESYLAIQQQRFDLSNNFQEAMRSRLQESAMDAIYILGEAMLDDKTSTKQQIKIAQTILDRAGFPRQKYKEIPRREERGDSMKELADKMAAIAKGL